MSDNFEHLIKFEIEEKCGEIFCIQNNFLIVCTECNGKHFSFVEFAEHFRVAHNAESNLEKNNLVLKSKDKINSSSNKKNTPVRSIATNISKPNTRNNKKTCLEPNKTPFESITLEQRNSPLNTDNDFAEISHDEDILQTSAEVSLKPYVKNKKNIKKEKISLELRKIHCCEQCDKRFVSTSQLKQHIQKKHTLEKNFKCNQCNESFREERSLKKHIREIHEGFHCTNCERSYKSVSGLREHMQTHRDTSDFKCDVENCGKSFKSLTKLRRHQRLHSADMRHVCEICGYRTREKHILVVHLRTHTGERPFPCKICGKHFISQSMVREHQATHAVQRNHECEVCGATFSRPKALYHHKHLHLGIKKFVCRICDKAYSQAAGLSAHMRQHKVDGKIM